MMFKAFAALLILASVCGPAVSQERIVSGRASVVDGDTLALEGVAQRVRLHGIDAPEGKQSCTNAAGQTYLCGAKAAQALAGLIGRNGRVVCRQEDMDRYGRIVARCSTRDRVEVNAAMVRSGWAVDYRRYSRGAYARQEQAARRDKAGLWEGRFVTPEEWRRGKRMPAGRGDPVIAVEGTCRIKGNIGQRARIYHMPGSAAYDSVRIDTSRGERWFCSEREARDAGWRPIHGPGGAS